MLTQVVLTVAESKRLIAKGVAAHPLVRRALESGTVVIARGTTNGYIAEELLGQPMDKAGFVTGRTLPRAYAAAPRKVEQVREIVLRRGQRVAGLTLAEALRDFKEGDVFIKGANALDYRNRAVGILIGLPDGGTIGAALPRIIGCRAHLVVPVGLEKLVASDLTETSMVMAGDPSRTDPVRAMWVIREATIVTELEALGVLAPGVSCHHLASGGIGGAEGAVRLLLCGDEEAVVRARELLDSIAGEPPFPI